MKKLQILFTAALLVAGLGLSAAADSCAASCCKQQGVKAGWFTSAGTLAKASCDDHAGCHCCGSNAASCCEKPKAGSCCDKSKADASCCDKPKADASCCDKPKAASCCDAKGSCDAKADAKCGGEKCSGGCKK